MTGNEIAEPFYYPPHRSVFLISSEPTSSSCTRRVRVSSRPGKPHYFLASLDSTYQRMFGGFAPEHSQVIHTAAVMAMEIIANSNAFYHNAEHSMMVTLVGQEIVRGKYLRDGGVSADEWVHFIVSLLCHDIGYVRGICPGDHDNVAVIDEEGGTVTLPPGATDAALTPYHVERGNM